MSVEPTIIKLKRADTAGILAGDGILAHGEPAVDFASGTLYIGDGTNTPGLVFASTDSDAAQHLIANTTGIGSSHNIVNTQLGQTLRATGSGTAKMQRLGFYDIGTGSSPGSFTGPAADSTSAGFQKRWHWMDAHVSVVNTIFYTDQAGKVNMDHSTTSGDGYKVKNLSYDISTLSDTTNGKKFALMAKKSGANNILRFEQLGYEDLTGDASNLLITGLGSTGNSMWYSDSGGNIQELTWSNSSGERGKVLTQTASTPQFERLQFSDITGTLTFSSLTTASQNDIIYHNGTSWTNTARIQAYEGGSPFYGFSVNKSSVHLADMGIKFDGGGGKTVLFGLHYSGTPIIDCFNNTEQELRIFTTSNPLNNNSDSTYNIRVTNKGSLEVKPLTETNNGADKYSLSIVSPTYSLNNSGNSSHVPNYYSIYVQKANFQTALTTSSSNTTKEFIGIYLAGSALLADGGHKGNCPSYTVIKSTDNTSRGSVNGLLINSLNAGDSTTASASRNTSEHARGIWFGNIISNSKVSGYARGILIDTISSEGNGSTGGARGVSMGTIESDRDSYGISIDSLVGKNIASGYNISNISNSGKDLTYGFNVNSLRNTGGESDFVTSAFRAGLVTSEKKHTYGLYLGTVSNTGGTNKDAVGVYISNVGTGASGGRAAGLYIGMYSGLSLRTNTGIDETKEYAIVTDGGRHYFGKDDDGVSAHFDGDVTIGPGDTLTVSGTLGSSSTVTVSGGIVNVTSGIVKELVLSTTNSSHVYKSFADTTMLLSDLGFVSLPRTLILAPSSIPSNYSTDGIGIHKIGYIPGVYNGYVLNVLFKSYATTVYVTIYSKYYDIGGANPGGGDIVMAGGVKLGTTGGGFEQSRDNFKRRLSSGQVYSFMYYNGEWHLMESTFADPSLYTG